MKSVEKVKIPGYQVIDGELHPSTVHEKGTGNAGQILPAVTITRILSEYLACALTPICWQALA